jgi:hypothetical protein
MVIWEGVLWGAFGGFAMEALDYIIAVRRWRKLPWLVGASTLAPDRRAAPHPRGGHIPEELPAPGLLAYTIAGALRITVGAGVAAAIVSTSPSAASPWLSVVAGAAAPLVLEKITMLVPLLMHAGRDGLMAVLQQPGQAGARAGREQGSPALAGTAAGSQAAAADTAADSTGTDGAGV